MHSLSHCDVCKLSLLREKTCSLNLVVRYTDTRFWLVAIERPKGIISRLTLLQELQKKTTTMLDH
jgi:hypothetical protein